MKTTWTKGLDEQGEADIKASFKSSTVIRARLVEICGDKSISSLTTNTNQYDSPNWCYQQADSIGYRRALSEIMSLLEK